MTLRLLILRAMEELLLSRVHSAPGGALACFTPQATLLFVEDAVKAEVPSRAKSLMWSAHRLVLGRSISRLPQESTIRCS